MAAPADLITQGYLSAALADMNLTPAELGRLPQLAAAASAAVRRYCNRLFTLATFDELYTVRSPDRRVTLRQFPVVSVDRCATGPISILDVWNTAANTTRAAVSLATTGDAFTGFTVTGLTLTRFTSGARVDTPVAFTAGMTAAGAAAAVVAAGGGWTAQAASGLTLWPVADLRPPQGPYAALGPGNVASLLVHADDVPCRVDGRLGYLALGSPAASALDSPRWGPGWSGEVNDAGSYGGTDGLRVVYSAGFAAVPDDVQLYTAEAAKAAVYRARTDPTLKSESDGVYSWTGRDSADLLALPREVLQGLSVWANRRASP